MKDASRKTRRRLRPVRVALVGCGEHAREDILPSLQLIDGVQLVALCDKDELFVREAVAVCPTAITDIRSDEIFDKKHCDAVVLACPPQLHYKFAKKALKNGIHVFVEKPPTVTKTELAELARLAARDQLVTMVGHNIRHSTAASVFHETIATPEFGKIVAVDMRYLVSGPKGKRWRLKSTIQSFLLSHAIHCIDLLVCEAGPIAKVSFAQFAVVATGEVLLVQLVFRCGAIGNLMAVTGASKFSIDLLALGDKGVVVHMPSLRKISVHGVGGMSSRWETVWSPRTLDGGYRQPGYQAELEIFFKAIGGESVASPSISDELHVYDVMQEIMAKA